MWRVSHHRGVFIIALTVPEAWHDAPGGLDGPVVLVVAYLLVRGIHLTLSTMAAADDSALRQQVRISWLPELAGAACGHDQRNRATDRHRQLVVGARRSRGRGVGRAGRHRGRRPGQCPLLMVVSSGVMLDDGAVGGAWGRSSAKHPQRTGLAKRSEPVGQTREWPCR